MTRSPVRPGLLPVIVDVQSRPLRLLPLRPVVALPPRPVLGLLRTQTVTQRPMTDVITRAMPVPPGMIVRLVRRPVRPPPLPNRVRENERIVTAGVQSARLQRVRIPLKIIRLGTIAMVGLRIIAGGEEREMVGETARQ